MAARPNGTVTRCAEGPGSARSVTVTFPAPPSPVTFGAGGDPETPLTTRQFDRFEAAMNGGSKVDIVTAEDGSIETLTTHKP